MIFLKLHKSKYLGKVNAIRSFPLKSVTLFSEIITINIALKKGHKYKLYKVVDELGTYYIKILFKKIWLNEFEATQSFEFVNKK